MCHQNEKSCLLEENCLNVCVTENVLISARKFAEHPISYQKNNQYDGAFTVTPKYVASLPDIQNESNEIKVVIQQIGIDNFKIPLHLTSREGTRFMIHCSVKGTVSLDAHKRGINMSRILRTFYENENCELNAQLLEKIACDYLEKLESSSAKISVAFDYPIRQKSLRSGLYGYQYYPVVMETVINKGCYVHNLSIDFVYSSMCPCSYELSKHAKETRSVIALPHGQRSCARLNVEHDGTLCIEDLVDIARKTLKTETQVIVKREDEQAFAELNAENLMFAEDAARRLYQGLSNEVRIIDFDIYVSHKESLHSHDVICVITKEKRLK
jgi:GTP cyclohydrolase I